MKKPFIKEGDLCPYCNTGDVVMRNGRFGGFFGCSRYPNCVFTQAIKPEPDILEQRANEILNQHYV